jgi:hypothetical protein
MRCPYISISKLSPNRRFEDRVLLFFLLFENIEVLFSSSTGLKDSLLKHSNTFLGERFGFGDLLNPPIVLVASIKPVLLFSLKMYPDSCA